MTSRPQRFLQVIRLLTASAAVTALGFGSATTLAAQPVPMEPGPSQRSVQRTSTSRTTSSRSAAQRSTAQRSSAQRTTSRRAAPQSSRSTARPSSSSRSTPTRSVRSTPTRVSSRPSSTPTASRPSYTPTRPTATPTRSSSPGSVISGRPAPSQPSLTPTSRPSSSRPQPIGSPTTGWSTPGRSSIAGSRTTTSAPGRSAPTVVEFGEAVVPARRPFPSPSAAPTRTSPGAGKSRSLNQRIRGLSSDVDLARVRSNPSAAPRSRGQLSHADVLSRYRPGAIATEPSPSISSSAPTDSGSDASDASRISAARRDAAARSATARTAAAREKQASQDAARIQAARADAANQATEGRVRAAREQAAAGAATDDPTRARIEAARRDKAASNEARTQAARGQYLERVQAARAAATPTGGGLVAGTSANGDVWDTGHGDYHSGGYYNDCYWNTWGSCWSLGWCSWWCGPSYCSGLWWHAYWWSGGSWCSPWNYYWYGPFLPNSYAVVYQDVEPEVIYVEVPAADAGEAVVPAEAPAFVPPTKNDPAVERELNRATSYYLTQGDRAFRDARYGDAAHFYAKALEYSPDSGILYLVLADALFATGDYRYAAFAIRKALEVEPELASNVIDKRLFYAIPGDFDRQLATLERFVDDHVIDDDARLVLAANYLFGGRPAAAVDLFKSPFSENLAKSPAGTLILEAASAAQFGRAETGSPEGPPAVAPLGAPAEADAAAGATADDR